MGQRLDNSIGGFSYSFSPSRRAFEGSPGAIVGDGGADGMGRPLPVGFPDGGLLGAIGKRMICHSIKSTMPLDPSNRTQHLLLDELHEAGALPCKDCGLI
jgi:hypothetical protein